jgi:2-oxoglutarate ferredoxin oxidoreductase subunit delta
MERLMAKKDIKGRIAIDRDVCKACYLCISVCPNEIISVSDRLNLQGYYPAEIKMEKYDEKGCIACAMCAMICPDIAIEVYRE